MFSTELNGLTLGFDSLTVHKQFPDGEAGIWQNQALCQQGASNAHGWD